MVRQAHRPEQRRRAITNDPKSNVQNKTLTIRLSIMFESFEHSIHMVLRLSGVYTARIDRRGRPEAFPAVEIPFIGNAGFMVLS
jgi:hypothetical protein